MPDENLKGVGDLVKEALESSGDTAIKEGVESQAELDAKAPGGNQQPEQNQIPPTNDPVYKAPEPPAAGQAPPVGNAGDKIEGQAPPTPATPEVNPWDTKWSENFKDQSIEDVKKTIGESATQKARIKELEDLNNDYSGKLNQKLDPFANPEIAELNQFVKETGINDSSLFKTLKNTNLAEANPQRVLEIQMKKDNPDLSSAEIKGYIDRRYNVGAKNFDHIIDEDDKRIAEETYKNSQSQSEVDMKMDANKARTELFGIQEKIKPVDLRAEMEQNQKVHQENVRKAQENWSPHINESIEELRQYKIGVSEKGENKELAQFEVPADKLQVYSNQAMQFAVNNGLDPASAEGKSQVNKFVANLVLIDHGPQIIQKTYNAARAGMEVEVDREISNPTGETIPPTGDQAAHIPQKPKTADEHENAAYEGAMNQIETGDY
jgi:hypothetical protein